MLILKLVKMGVKTEGGRFKRKIKTSIKNLIILVKLNKLVAIN